MTYAGAACWYVHDLIYMGLCLALPSPFRAVKQAQDDGDCVKCKRMPHGLWTLPYPGKFHTHTHTHTPSTHPIREHVFKWAAGPSGVSWHMAGGWRGTWLLWTDVSRHGSLWECIGQCMWPTRTRFVA
jgi:hypothetical protein